MSVETTLEIAASPARVWTLLDDPECLPLWMPNVVETQYPSGRPAHGGRGVTFRQIVDDRGTEKVYEGEVTAFEAGRLLAVRITDGSMIIDAAYAIEARGSGTLLTFKGDVRMSNPLMNMMMLAAWPMTRTLMLDQIKSLKAVAEASNFERPTVTKSTGVATTTSSSLVARVSKTKAKPVGKRASKPEANVKRASAKKPAKRR